MTHDDPADAVVGTAAAPSWIALVQAGMLVGKYPSNENDGNGRAATRIAVADDHEVEVYEVDLRTCSPPPPIGTEVEPALWGWRSVR